jgi:lysophospholipase L1-like esterase
MRHPLLRKRLIPAAILAPALAAMVMAASTSARAEQATSARASPARKLSYQDYRRGLFALSKTESASIVMLGDSLTEGAPWEELTGCARLVNRGVSGDTTPGVLARLDEIVKLKPRAVFLMIGVNDISRHVPKETSVESLRAILDRLERAGIRTFAFHVLPVTASYARKERKNDSINALNAAIAGVFAQHPGTQVIDLRPLVRGSDGALREELSYNGLHLSPKGYEIWRDAIAPEVEKYCGP